MAGNHSKTTKEVWEKVRIDYHLGNYKTLEELANRYQVNPGTLRRKVINNEWNIEKKNLQSTLLTKVEEIKETEAEKYLRNAFQRILRYERIIDASQQNLGSKDQNGTPLLDPEAINDYTIAEQRIHAIAKSVLRIPEPSQALDLTSKGQSLGESLLSAISKIRANGGECRITSEDVDRILEAEIIEDEKPKA